MINIYYIFFILLTITFFCLHLFCIKYMKDHFEYSLLFVKLIIENVEIKVLKPLNFKILSVNCYNKH